MIIQNKPIQLNNKALLLVFLMFCNLFVYGQLKNFGSKAIFKPEPNFKYSVYAYYDIIRESGIGFQYQIGNIINLDVSAYLINNQNNLNRLIKQWDYYEFKGYGFSLKPKYLLLNRLSRFYVGANIAYEFLHHDKVWVDYSYSDDYQRYNLEDAKGSVYTIGFTLGNRMTVKHMLFEPFFGMGYTASNIVSTAFAAKGQNADPNTIFPYSYRPKHDYFQLNIGIKLGYSFKRNKKHDAVDKKFDDVYIPKTVALENYFKSVDFKDKTSSKKSLKEALNRFEALNRNTLKAYKRNYRDTAAFYNKVNFLFDRIDGLIIFGNK